MTTDHWHNFTDSTIILGAGIKNGKLRVMFQNNGRVTGTYQYVTDNDSGQPLCCLMAMATSKGTFFHQHIRPLPYVKVH